MAPSPGVCQRAPAFVLLEDLGLQLSVSAAEARRRIHGSKEGPASLGISASSRRLSGSPPAPRRIRPPPEFRRGGGRRCSATSSITARKTPQFLETPPLPAAADCPLPRLRQPAETVARPAGAARRRCCILKRSQTKVVRRLELDTATSGIS